LGLHVSTELHSTWDLQAKDGNLMKDMISMLNSSEARKNFLDSGKATVQLWEQVLTPFDLLVDKFYEDAKLTHSRDEVLPLLVNFTEQAFEQMQKFGQVLFPMLVDEAEIRRTRTFMDAEIAKLKQSPRVACEEWLKVMNPKLTTSSQMMARNTTKELFAMEGSRGMIPMTLPFLAMLDPGAVLKVNDTLNTGIDLGINATKKILYSVKNFNNKVFTVLKKRLRCHIPRLNRKQRKLYKEVKFHRKSDLHLPGSAATFGAFPGRATVIFVAAAAATMMW
jgi:hypothetical protein